MARPRKATDTKATARVAFRVTPADLSRLTTDAERLGLTVSELGRQRVLTGRVVVKRSAELAASDRVELGRVGVNVNQIARHLNEHGGSIPAIAEMEAQARHALDLLNRLLLKVGADDSEAD